MNENQKKELNERFDKRFPELVIKGMVIETASKSSECQIYGIDILIKDFINSEIENAEKRAIQTLPAFPIMSEKFKREYRIEGARELAKRLKEWLIPDYYCKVEARLAELEGENK